MSKLALRLHELLLLVRKEFWKLCAFSFVFFLVKASAFGAALWLSNMISIAEFGLFEFALSGGLIVAVLLNVGMQGAYPFFIIKADRADYRAVFFLHGLVLTGGFVTLIFINKMGGHWVPIKFSLLLLMGSVFAMQALYSTILKSHEILIPAIFLDGGFFLSVNVYNGLLYSEVVDFSIEMLETGLMIYVSFLWVLYFREFIVIKKQFTLEKYRKALHFGKHLVLSAFLIILLTGGARIFIERFLAIEEVGYYGFYFRLASATVLIHQIINIVFFKKMYESNARTLDFYFSLFIGSVLLLSISMSFLVPAIFSEVLTLLATSYADYQSLYWILSFQVVFWIVLALNENVIYREELATPMNRGFIIIFLLMLGTMIAFSHLQILDIFWLSTINMLAIGLAVEWQFFLLKKQKNIAFTNTRRVSLSALLLFCITYNLMI
ncbi:MAG: hypothetical protein AAF573_05945 [Bacteroidota bacterium]